MTVSTWKIVDEYSCLNESARRFCSMKLVLESSSTIPKYPIDKSQSQRICQLPHDGGLIQPLALFFSRLPRQGGRTWDFMVFLYVLSRNTIDNSATVSHSGSNQLVLDGLDQLFSFLHCPHSLSRLTLLFGPSF